MKAQDELDPYTESYYHLDDISPRRQSVDASIITFVDSLTIFAERHWLLLFNIANGLIFLGAFVVPLLHRLGQEWIAGPLFASYRILCVQNPGHSYFIFGYQMAMDQRMTAIFGAILATGVVYALLGRNLRPLNWRLYLLCLVPIALDGFTQLFGWRQSNWQLRTITGVLFGIASVWLAYPLLDLHVSLMLGKSNKER
ncbi:MAG: DUF2085 domain-containing protein [Chloroflexi bacterium]|nr:DUF2085 domain-containing protein [Chloroflexota bacterium]